MSEEKKDVVKIGESEISFCPDAMVDEIVIRRNGECIFHLEKMNDKHYWLAVYDGGKQAVVQIKAREKINMLLDFIEADE